MDLKANELETLTGQPSQPKQLNKFSLVPSQISAKLFSTVNPREVPSVPKLKLADVTPCF